LKIWKKVRPVGPFPQDLIATITMLSDQQQAWPQPAQEGKSGRPKALTTKQRGIAHDLYEKQHPVAAICQTLKISIATLYRVIKAWARD
jgi:DNA invertase Pin-like site-specific DNA recombinase